MRALVLKADGAHAVIDLPEQSSVDEFSAMGLWPE